jgi:hypothetical protein
MGRECDKFLWVNRSNFSQPHLVRVLSWPQTKCAEVLERKKFEQLNKLQHLIHTMGWPNPVKRSAIFFTAFAYLYMAGIFVFRESLEKSVIAPIFILWILGVCAFVANLIYAVSMNVSRPHLLALIIFGMVFAFPIILYSVAGIPMLILYTAALWKLFRLKKTTIAVGKSKGRKGK